MGNKNVCCSQRDKNDLIVGIETRNDKHFILNYPRMVRDIDRKLKKTMDIQKYRQSDLTNFKAIQKQLKIEIEYNQRKLEEEQKQKTTKRLMIEICEATGITMPILFAQSYKCQIRVKYRGISRKTQKNMNCQNPKFFQLLKFPVNKIDPEDWFEIQFVVVDNEKVRKVIAKQQFKISQFNDQVLHFSQLDLPILRVPQELEYRHKKGLRQSQKEQLFKQSQEQYNRLTGDNFAEQLDQIGSPRYDGQDQNPDDLFSALSPRSQEAGLFSPKSNTINRRDSGSFGTRKSAQNDDDDEQFQLDAYPENPVKLSIRVQIVQDGPSFLNDFLKQYEERLEKVIKFLDAATLQIAKDKSPESKQNQTPTPDGNTDTPVEDKPISQFNIAQS
ncbi:UNKNOWN [Stylonychia lemnae]|uniref:C2 domain-containing protein n=1 Tax=Stylonychia lemnae TaxID=5949 RepID=A0A077ZQH5_STYLE|nr:UNKNOWN [Stylonychia lemnae]|eukprot:CDW72163.1 UNKNOWN [Stylonychia lemnae]